MAGLAIKSDGEKVCGKISLCVCASRGQSLVVSMALFASVGKYNTIWTKRFISFLRVSQK